jgi:tRNA-binding protein
MSECLTTGVPDENGAVVLISPDTKVPNGVKLF